MNSEQHQHRHCAKWLNRRKWIGGARDAAKKKASEKVFQPIFSHYSKINCCDMYYLCTETRALSPNRLYYLVGYMSSTNDNNRFDHFEWNKLALTLIRLNEQWTIGWTIHFSKRNWWLNELMNEWMEMYAAYEYRTKNNRQWHINIIILPLRCSGM